MQTKINFQDERITIGNKLFAFLQKISSAIFYPLVICVFLIWFFWIGILINFFVQDSTIGLLLIDFSTFFLVNLDWIIFFYLIFYLVKEEIILLFILIILGLFLFILIQDSLLSSFEESIIFESVGNFRIINLSFIGKISIALLVVWIYNNWQKKIINYTILKIIQISLIILFIFVFLALLTILIMPIIIFSIFRFSILISSLPFGLNTFFYGFFNRILAFFGLQSFLIVSFLFGPAGGYITVNGEIIAQGDMGISIFILENFSSGYNQNYINQDIVVSDNYSVGQYQQGFLPIFIFCYPAAGWVIYKKTDDKTLGKKYLFYAFLPMISGITEPFEALFIFTMPILFFLNAVLVGISFWLLYLMDTSIMISNAGILDFIFFGVVFDLTGIFDTNFQNVIIVGIILGIIYYFMFKLFYKPPVQKKEYNNYKYY